MPAETAYTAAATPLIAGTIAQQLQIPESEFPEEYARLERYGANHACLHARLKLYMCACVNMCS